jgi:hypothetical protein
MRSRKRVDSDFKIGFESGTIRTNMVFDGRNI